MPLLRLTCLIDHQSFVHEFKSGTVVLGRLDECDIAFPMGKGVSARHAQLHLDSNADAWTITDLNSRYGTQVNDERVTTRQLSHRDAIRMGRFSIDVEVIDSTDADSTSPDDVSIRNTINIRDFLKSIGSSDFFTGRRGISE